LDETIAGPDLLCIVIFRGDWCKYDKHYLQKLGLFCKAQPQPIQLVAWTSQGAAGAAKADEEWELTKSYGYDKVLGDETNALANWLKEDELLPDITTVAHDGYANGMVLPAQIWYAHHGSPVFEWYKDKDEPGRPQPSAVWEQVVKRKHALDVGSTVMAAHPRTIPLCSTDVDIALSACSVS
jgi:hypothetical protein